jgi:hypothetical protein
MRVSGCLMLTPRRRPSLPAASSFSRSHGNWRIPPGGGGGDDVLEWGFFAEVASNSRAASTLAIDGGLA